MNLSDDEDFDDEEDEDELKASLLLALQDSGDESEVDQTKKEGNQSDEPPVKKRRRWVKDCRLLRKTFGEAEPFNFATDKNTEYFTHILKLTESDFYCLLEKIKDDIKKRNTLMRDAISAEEKLAVTLRFLATGESYKKLEEESNLSKSFLSSAIIEVCDAIYTNLKDPYLKFPSNKEQWTKIAEGFNEKYFPHCIGALGGMNIGFFPEKKYAQHFVNENGLGCIVFLAIADVNGSFIFIDVGRNGALSFNEVLQKSQFMYILQEPEKYIPPADFSGNTSLLPYVFIASKHFPLWERVMVPYPSDTTDEREKLFNNILNEAHDSVRNAFRIMTTRFHILQKQIYLRDAVKVRQVVLCCCALHNFLLARNPSYAEIIKYEEIDNNDTKQYPPEKHVKGEAIREELADFFMAISDG